MKNSTFGGDNREKDGLKCHLDRISDVLDNGIDKLLETKVNKHYKVDDGAREELRRIFGVLLSGLCTPKVPSSISECETRLCQWRKVDAKVKPSETERDAMRHIATRGKKGKTALNFDKVYSVLKQWHASIDMNVALFLVLIAEAILQAYLRVGIDYQAKMKAEHHPPNVLVLNTFKLIFAKYTNMDELHNLIIYDHIKKYTKSCKTWESQKNFHPFVKECRAQVEVILKLFKLPLQQANVDSDLLNKLFGNIDVVYDSLGFIVEATEDCKDSTKMNLGNELMELVIMDVFQPFETYAKSVLNLEHFEVIDKLLFSRDSMVPVILASHYGQVINIVFGKSTPRRRTELLSRYHLLHSCGSCLNPTDLPTNYTYPSYLAHQPQNSSTLATSPSTDTFLSYQTHSSNNLTTNQSNMYDQHGSGNSSGPSNQSGSSSSGHSSRGSSPYPQPASSGYKTGSKDDFGSSFPTKSFNSLSCNILVNSFRYLLPRLLLYPVFQFLYLYHILQNMSQPADDAASSDTNSLSHVVRSMLQYARTFNVLLYQHDRLMQLEFERSRCWFRVSEGSRDNIKDGNQKLEEIDGMMLRKLSDIAAATTVTVSATGGHAYLSASNNLLAANNNTYSSGLGSTSSSDEYSISREYKGKTEFVMEGAVKFQFLGTSSNYACKSSGKSSSVVHNYSSSDESNASLYSMPCYPPPPPSLFSHNSGSGGVGGANNTSSSITSTTNSSSTNSKSNSSGNYGGYSDRYLYLFSNFLLICKKTVKKSGFITGGQHSTKLRFKGKILLDGQFSIRDDDVYKEGNEAAVYQRGDNSPGTISPSSSPATTHSTHLQSSPKIHSFILEFPAESSTGFQDLLNSSNSASHHSHHHGSMHSRSSPVSCHVNNSSNNATSVYPGSSSPTAPPVSQLSRSSKTLAYGSTNTLTSAKTLTPDGKDSLQSGVSSDRQSLFSSTSSYATHFSSYTQNNHPPQQHQVVLAVRIILPSAEDKADWIASLLMLQTHKLFYQFVVLKYYEEVPLKLPDASVYRFAQPDSQFNIEYEPSVSDNSSDIPIIRAATLEKLVTHLTSHSFCDTKTLNKFLLIYRQFTTPKELLTTLIDRFEIPDPQFSEEEKPTHYFHTSLQERMLKRFRTSYKRKVQLRVINFLALWTSSKNRFFKKDFTHNQDLLDILEDFLNRQTHNSTHLTQKIASIHKQITSQSATSLLHTNTVSSTAGAVSPVCPEICTEDAMCSDPMIDSIFSTVDSINLLNVHPVELAQQITLLEWRLYSKIEFWEVHSREISSEPNYLTSLEFSNKIMHWLVLEIVSRTNMLDRATVILRVIDLMLIFEEQSNLQGSQECRGSLVSSAVYRLRNTFEFITNQSSVNSTLSSNTPCYQFPTKNSRNKYKTEIERLRRQEEDNTSESYTTTYKKKVYTVVAPAIPYIAMGDKTNLIHLDQSNPDFIVKKVLTDPYDPDSGKTVKLINFCKFRLMANLIQHYLSFQSIGYQFKEEPAIQSFLRKLDPYKIAGVDEKHKFDEYAYKLSLQIQPRSNDHTQPSVAPEKRSMTDDQIRFSTNLLEQNLKYPLDTASSNLINRGNTTNNSPVTMPLPPPPRPPRKASNPFDPPARPPRSSMAHSNNCLSTTDDSPPPPLPSKPSSSLPHHHNPHQRHHSLSPPMLSPPPLPRKLGGGSSVSSTPPPLPPPPLQHQ